MLVLGVIMIVYGAWSVAQGETVAIVVIVFSVLSIVNGWTDMKILRAGPVTGRERIVQHLSHTLGATIATITAFAAINAPKVVGYQPGLLLIAWLAPTIIIAPLMGRWEEKISRRHAAQGHGKLKLTLFSSRPCIFASLHLRVLASSRPCIFALKLHCPISNLD